MGGNTTSSTDLAAGGGTGTNGNGMYGNNAVRRYAGGVGSISAANGTPGDKALARLPKTIAMFASRACRSSIMIGKSLNHREMERIVRRMADVNEPWNCPHGRPTMIHLSDVSSHLKHDEKQSFAYYTEPMATLVLSQEVQSDEDDA
jgi:hypothetical protein